MMGLLELYPKHSRWLLLHLKQVGRPRSHLTRRRTQVQQGLGADEIEANSPEGNMASCGKFLFPYVLVRVLCLEEQKMAIIEDLNAGQVSSCFIRVSCRLLSAAISLP